MRAARYISLAFVLGPLACASSPRDAATPPPSQPEVPASGTEPTAESVPAEDDDVTQAPTGQGAADADPFAEERAKMHAEAEKERQRWTPELREQARALASKSYPDLKSALTAALAGPHRVPNHASRDDARHPVETLRFFGLKPTMTVLEYGPGAGWYTELLAPTLAAQGKLIVTSTDPKGPRDVRATLYAERLDAFLTKAPEVYGKVERAIFDPASPELALDGEVDLALVIRGMHGWVRDDTMDRWLGEIHQALEPGGVLGIVQHRAAPGADPVKSAAAGYLPEPWVIEQVEARGFELAEKSEINANPRDTRDHQGGVWALPPTLRNGDQDREKYVAIGESDRMTLRFTKVAK